MSRRKGTITIPKVYTGPEPNLPQNQGLMNDFSGGLKTEYHGLNFPPNAMVSEQNCRVSLTKEILRRGGIDYETNATTLTGATSTSVNTYKWNNVGGDGQTQIIVTQVGAILNFYLSSNTTSSSPVSAQLLAGQSVDTLTFLVVGSSNDPSTVECNFADGNGYLFVYNQYCEPFYITYNSGSQTISAQQINLQIRDFVGIPEPGVAPSTRPLSLTAEHQYNLQNQGWISAGAASWAAASSTNWTIATGAQTFIVQTGLTIPGGSSFTATVTAYYGAFYVGTANMSGTVTSYTSGSGSLVVNITSVDQYTGYNGHVTSFVSVTTGLITAWQTAIGNYPSNSDVWWLYKDTTGKFNPAFTGANVGIVQSGASSGPAPKGSYILNAFNLNRTAASGISALTTISTLNRPSTGTWFQGRVWFTGVNANFQPTGDAGYTTWTENIYFSQIVTNNSQFGMCYQTNDPTSESLFDLLPTDGGTITIQGSGAIYELFPLQNGLVVRAANGIWFITGSQGIGFSATDYTVTKISGVQSISNRPSVNILGFPTFWNQEGIWSVMPSQQGGGLVVQNYALDTILTFYNNIPTVSKKYVRGDYNPNTYEIQWLYRSTAESGLSNRYQMDTILCFNTHMHCFYHFTLSTGGALPNISGLNFVQGPGGANTSIPAFKYFVDTGTAYTFAQEFSNVWYDWINQGNQTSYTSSFTTAYYLHGQGIRKFQPNYLYIYSRNSANTSYVVQGTWDFALSGNSGRISMRQQVNNTLSPTNYGMLYRRHKLLGRGQSIQIQITSIDGLPFDFMGWAVWEVMNANP